jgi:hypothetical protein
LPRGEKPGGLADQEAALADRVLQLRILGRIHDVDGASQHGDGAVFQGCHVRRRIDTAG